MHRSLSCLRALLVVSSLLPSLTAFAAGPIPKEVLQQEKRGGTRPSPPAPFQDPNGDGDSNAPLGGPRVPLAPNKGTKTASAAGESTSPIRPVQTGPTADNKPTGSQPFVPGVTYSSASENAAPGSGQPPAALGPAPYDLGQIKKVVVGGQTIVEAPLRVGNLDILVPMAEELGSIGGAVSQIDPKLVPDGGIGPTEAQFFQINLTDSAPIVCTIGKDKARIESEDAPLRCAPLIIDKKIWLPVFSVTPLIGAAARLDMDGTLYLTPTVESVELFPVKDMIALTIKTSMRANDKEFKVGVLPGPDRLYVDFPGYSMGFDAGNSTFERAVSAGRGDVNRARAGMPSKFPDVTRITMDLKKPMLAVRQEVPDPNLVAFLLVRTDRPAPPPIPTGGGEIFPEDPPGTPIGQFSSGSLRGLTIVVDAGHGGHDTGARGGGSNEKDHTLGIAKRLAKNLSDKGAKVLMTRDSDIFISLDGRTSYANSRQADMFISIHINASVNKSSQGTETYYYTAPSVLLAREIHPEFLKATGRPNRGVRSARFYVIRKTRMPSVLLECAFISNSTEEKLMRTDAWREKIAQGVTRGVLNYVNKYKRGRGLSG